MIVSFVYAYLFALDRGLLISNTLRLGSRSSLIAVPIAVYYLVLHHLPEDKDDDDDKDDDHHPFDRYWKARLISLAVWVAVMLLVFVPMHMWKSSVRSSCRHRRNV